MRLFRLVPVIAAGALLAASVSPAQAQTTDASGAEGVGTTTGALTLLGLDAGGLLSLDLLTDAGRANIDESVGARSAAAQISALVVESPAAGVAESLPLLSVESTGAPEEQGQAATPIDNPVVSGSLLPLSLRALVDEVGATSQLSAGLVDLDVLGGVAGITGTELDLGSQALVDDAAGSRGVTLDALTVLDLEALLAGLGIPLTDLSFDTLLALVDSLGLLSELSAALEGLGLPGLDLDALSIEGLLAVVDGLLDEADGLLDGVDALTSQVDALTGQITSLESLQSTLTADADACDVADPALDLLDDLLGGGTTASDLCADVTGTLTSITGELALLDTELSDLTDLLDPLTTQLDALLDQLQGALEAPLDLLGGQTLLGVDGLDVTVVTQATDDVATSIADVTGTLGELRVGDLALGALDLSATTEQVDHVLARVEGTLGGVLGQISPALADLVDIRTLEETTSVVEEAGSVVASAAFTGLQVDVLPEIAELQDLLAGLGGVDSLGAQLADLGLPVPTSGATEVLQLNSLLAGVPTGGLVLGDGVAALTEGLSVRVASLTQQSTFTPVAVPSAPAPAPAPQPTLPATGSDDGLVLLLAAAAVLTALGGRHLLRRAA